MAVRTRTVYPLAEIARIDGGTLITQHGLNCTSHIGGECACNPHYASGASRVIGGR